MAYQTPDSNAFTKTITLTNVPQALTSVLSGHLFLLTKDYYWESRGDMSVQDCVDAMAIIFEEWSSQV